MHELLQVAQIPGLHLVDHALYGGLDQLRSHRLKHLGLVLGNRAQVPVCPYFLEARDDLRPIKLQHPYLTALPTNHFRHLSLERGDRVDRNQQSIDEEHLGCLVNEKVRQDLFAPDLNTLVGSLAIESKVGLETMVVAHFDSSDVIHSVLVLEDPSHVVPEDILHLSSHKVGNEVEHA